MNPEGSREVDDLGEDYSGWPLRQRLELLAFDARLAEVPPALIAALWEAIDSFQVRHLRAFQGDPEAMGRRFQSAAPGI